jgi:hypothetical protein
MFQCLRAHVSMIEITTAQSRRIKSMVLSRLGTRCVYSTEDVADVAVFSSHYSADGARHTSPGAATCCSVFGWASFDAVDAALSDDTSAILR